MVRYITPAEIAENIKNGNRFFWSPYGRPTNVISKVYNKRVNTYNASAFKQEDVLRQVDDFFFGILGEERKREKDITWLDIGCGPGDRTLEYLKRMKEMGYSVSQYACDISPLMAEKAREKGLRARQASMGSVPSAFGKRFDIVTALYGVPNHMPIELIPSAIRKVRKIIEKGGLFLTDVITETDYLRSLPGGDNPDNRYFIYALYPDSENPNPELAGCVYVFKPGEFDEIVKGAGFEIIKKAECRKEEDIALDAYALRVV